MNYQRRREMRSVLPSLCFAGKVGICLALKTVICKKKPPLDPLYNIATAVLYILSQLSELQPGEVTQEDVLPLIREAFPLLGTSEVFKQQASGGGLGLIATQ